jgi:hypothetical protein
LPTGDLQSAGVISLQLDLSATAANVNRLDLIDIPLFTGDVDGDALTSLLVSGDHGGILSDEAVTIDDAVADGDRQVVRQLDETEIDNLSAGGVTQLRLTIDAQVADAEGIALTGESEFTVDLLAP